MRLFSRIVAIGVVVGASALVGPSPTQAGRGDDDTSPIDVESLHCVLDASLGQWPKHTDDFYVARLRAFDAALQWAPHWPTALDAKAVSQMRLGRLEAAHQTLQHRLSVAPDAYRSHTNLGTLYTIQGRWDEALKHVDRALELEPEADGGRERVHRQLVVFMQRVEFDPEIGRTANFLGIRFEGVDRLSGSPEAFAAAGQTPEVLDALLYMIIAYPGSNEGLAELYLALGEALSLYGEVGLAYSAFRRATEQGHSRSEQLRAWQADISASMRARHVAGGGDEGTYVGVGKRYVERRVRALRAWTAYSGWERRAVRRGLKVWTEAGLDTTYQKMRKIRPQCGTLRVIDAAEPESAPAPGSP